jgi:hypothetical protein
MSINESIVEDTALTRFWDMGYRLMACGELRLYVGAVVLEAIA